MNHFVHETTPPVPKNDPNPGIRCLKSGKWVAKIQHPMSKGWVLLGTYTTPEEAADTCTRKKLEYESSSLQDLAASSFNTSRADFESHPGVRRMKSGRWGARINHICLGTYATPKEAAHAYIMSKIELDSQKSSKIYDAGLIRPQRAPKIEPEAEQSKAPQQRQRHASRTSSGRWRIEIRHPITKARVHLGTFDAADEAEQAYDNKRREFDLMVCGGHRKKKRSNDACEGDVIARGESDSKCVSNDPSVPANGSSVTHAKVGSEAPIFGSETTKELDLDVVDSYGRLIGEYCRMDDEMWLCSSVD